MKYAQKYDLLFRIFHQSSRQQNEGVFFSDNWCDVFTKNTFN